MYIPASTLATGEQSIYILGLNISQKKLHVLKHENIKSAVHTLIPLCLTQLLRLSQLCGEHCNKDEQ